MKFILRRLLSKALKSFSELCEEQFYKTSGFYTWQRYLHYLQQNVPQHLDNLLSDAIQTWR